VRSVSAIAVQGTVRGKTWTGSTQRCWGALWNAGGFISRTPHCIISFVCAPALWITALRTPISTASYLRSWQRREKFNP